MISTRAISRSLRHATRLSSARRAYHASVLPNQVSPGAPDFQERARAMDTLVSELEGKLATNRQGGGPKALDRMRSKGKLTPRERCVEPCSRPLLSFASRSPFLSSLRLSFVSMRNVKLYAKMFLLLPSDSLLSSIPPHPSSNSLR
jgi:hypothetical protein